MAFLDPSSPQQKESGWGGRNLKLSYSSENTEHYLEGLSRNSRGPKLEVEMQEKKKRTPIEDALLFWIGLRVQSWIVGWKTCVKCRIMDLAVERKKKGLESWIGLCQFTAVMIIRQGTRT